MQPVLPGADRDLVRRPSRLRWSLLVAIAALAGTLVAPAGAAANEFPKGSEGFHTYTEMAAEVAAVAAAHPDIVERFSIGRSYLGRQLWAVKVSDHVAIDEAEPEVLFDGGTHSDEHMGVEMTLRILHWLVDGYGTDPRITRIVDDREIWIVFSMNPDGAEYDIAGGRYRSWRKNRQPTPGTSSIGTDLNRNYGYRWGGGGRTSSNPRAITYRGPRAFSSPEARAMRDFLASRVVGGRQQIRTAISFHEYGRLVLWPYGYTTTDRPSDTTVQDQAALVRIGRHMAASSRYRPEQASDLYVTSGSSTDFAYGRYRIFAFTIELSAVNYPDDSHIAPETGRNRESVLYLAEQAGCPYAVLGASVAAARCGAFDDDLEIARGWRVDPDGTDTAPASGRFARGNPAATAFRGPKQLGTVTSGSSALVTGLAAGVAPASHDLDGRTSVRSPTIDLPAGAGQRLTFRYVFAHDARSTTADVLRAVVEAADGTRTVVFSRAGGPTDVDGAWRSASVPLDPWAGQSIHLRFEAEDGGPGGLVEVEIDDVRVTRPG